MIDNIIYKDEKGWLYKVMSNHKGDAYRAWYKKPRKTGWRCVKELEWKSNPRSAQLDLDKMAKINRWVEIQSIEKEKEKI